MKNLFEIDKESLLKRINDEKERAQRQINAVIEEHEMKQRDDMILQEDQVELLQQQLQDNDSQSQQIISQYEHDSSLKSQKISTLEVHLSELKENMDKSQNQNNTTLESHLVSFNSERKSMIEKLETHSMTIANKERSITTLENQKKSLEVDI